MLLQLLLLLLCCCRCCCCAAAAAAAAAACFCYGRASSQLDLLCKLPYWQFCGHSAALDRHDFLWPKLITSKRSQRGYLHLEDFIVCYDLEIQHLRSHRKGFCILRGPVCCGQRLQHSKEVKWLYIYMRYAGPEQEIWNL